MLCDALSDARNALCRWEKKVLFDIARRAHSAQMAQIVLFMQRQCKAALTVVHRDIIQVVQNAFVTAVTDFNANIAEQTATLHRRMKSRSVFCEAFQATKAVIDRALQCVVLARARLCVGRVQGVPWAVLSRPCFLKLQVPQLAVFPCSTGKR